VEKAARLIGIIDEFGVLKENEIYCSYSANENDQIVVHNVTGVGQSQSVIITRNPWFETYSLFIILFKHSPRRHLETKSCF